MKKLTLVALSCITLILVFTSGLLKEESRLLLTDPTMVPVLPDEPINYPHFLDRIPENPPGNPDNPNNGGWNSNPVVVNEDLSGIGNQFNGVSIYGATLGRVLFYDKKLSSTEKFSCGSCHLQELSFADEEVFSEGVNSLTQRNSMHLNDLGWSNNEHFSWSMKHTDLKSMIRLPLLDANEIDADIEDVITKMYETDYYPPLFKRAFSSEEITEERIVKALFQFISSMVTFNTKFDKGKANEFKNFTKSEKRGMALFNASCNTCHGEGTLQRDKNDSLSLLESKPFLFFNGTTDNADVGAGVLDPEFNNHFKIPTLRNIALTAPYMHDGRFETLEEVVEHYSKLPDEIKVHSIPWRGFDFDDTQKEDLIAFLHTLTDHSFLTNEAWADPFEPVFEEDQSEFENVILRPNPMHDQAIIEFKNVGNQQVSINVRTSDGKLIHHDQIDSDQYLMDKGLFDSGVYFIELIMNEKRSIQKLIVK